MKKILSIITAMVMIFCLFPPVRSFAADTETVGYIAYVSDGNGGYKAQTKNAECTVIDSANIISSLTNGQYAVKGDVTIRDRIKISGDVQLILTDGCTLNAQNGINLPESSTLSICGQSGGTGKLNAESSSDTAIGGNFEESCGTLNVYGGQVSANSTNDDAAIGGGDSTGGTAGNGGTVNVYGGKLTAGSSGGVAIGGGYCNGGTSGSGSNLSVYGGEVIALAGSSRAIGKGSVTNGTAGRSGQTFISGGSVIAYSKGLYGLAFDHAPTYGTNYIPKVTYGESDTNTATEISPKSTKIHIYGYSYVSINNSAVDVDYVNNRWDGQKVVQSIETAKCLMLGDDYKPSELKDGWYSLSKDVTISDRIKISGEVHLILTDGCKLDATQGINLPEGNTLNIYGQGGGTGKLNAIYTFDGTAIGGDSGYNCGTLNVYGGDVSAASDSGAAIGGGFSASNNGGNGGTVNVYGGNVIATSTSGAAIGGGYSIDGTAGNGGIVKVYGGEVSAASDSGAAIGGGCSTDGTGGDGSTVEIYGGKVSATSTDGAAIGGGNSTDGTGGDGSTVNVYGGEVIAESYNVAAIGGGVNANGVSGSVGQTFISGGSVRAYSGKAAFDHVPTFGAGYIPKVTYGEYGTSTTSAVNPADSVYTSNKYISIKNAPNAYANVDYITNTWDGQKIVQSIETAICVKLNKDHMPSELTSGWYALGEDVVINDRIKIRGDVQLILTDGCTLNAKRGINLPESSTLSIYGQSGGTGKLNADSGNKTAIGGEDEESCGTLNVYGGQVSAVSPVTAIGGGKSAIKTAGNGGTVNVYGGQVSAESSGTAIGGGGSTDGTGGNGGTVNVYGGMVNALSDSETAIGGGFSTSGTGGTGSKLNVYGGEVIAESHLWSAISGGRSTSGTAGNPGTTHICGGSVSAYSKQRIAFDHSPTYGTNYIPKVSYGESDTSTVTKINPDNSVYTSNKYVSIEKADLTADYQYCSRSWNGSSVVSSIETQNCTTLNNEYFPKTLNSGWYAVEGNVTVLNQIEISGNVNLILTDGCKLTANNGIHLTDGNVLNIYVQSGETGKLEVSCTDARSAIGGNNSASPGGNGESCGDLNIHGGTVNVSASYTSIGGAMSAAGTGGNGGTVTIYNGKLTASSENATAIGGGTSSGTNGNCGKTVIYGGSVSVYSEKRIAFDHAPTYGTNYIPKVTYGESDTSTVTKINPDNSVYTSNKYVSIEKADLTADYQYCSRSWNGSSVVSSIETANCTTLDNTNFPTALSDGWYAVKGDVTVSDRITISGDVHLILTDGCKLNAKKGINLPENSTLSIYGQSGGTGKLAASIYNYVIAAIGGGIDCESCGTLNIFGGEISAFSEYGAGIGSGRDNDENDENSGGIITIYGGKVTVDGHDSGIGGAPNDITLTGSSGSVLTIYGGDVTASCKGRPAIGGPDGGDGGSLAFYGGTLTAYSEYSICIGSEINRNNAVPSKGADTVVTIGKSVRIYTSPNADGSGKTLLTGYTDLGAELAKYKYAQFIINPCDHSGNTNPTCEGANCSVCGTYIAPTGHKNGDPVTENRTFASCTEGGSYDEVVYCSVCGKEMSRETKAIEPSEHTAGKPVIENEAADGTYDEVVYCSVCNAEMSRERKVKAEHKHIEGMADVITMPTFTSAGSRVFRCTLCGEILRSEAIPPITMDFPTNTVSSDNASQVIYTEFPELKFNVEIKDGIAVISWDKVETADRYVIYAIKDGKISEIAKIRKTSFETKHQNGTNYFVRYMKNGVLSPRSKSINEDITSDKPIVSASAGKDFIRLDWQDMGAEKYNIYKYADGKAIKIGEVKKTAVKIINLSPDTEYKFIVTAVIDGKETTMLMRDILTVRTKKA